jgi:telomere length regulation protein
MVTGEYIMNHLLHPSNKDPLKFSYPSTPSIVWLKSLMRDIDEQEKELREQSRKYQETISSSPQLKIPDKTEDNQMFGQGMARTNEAINDSDDDDLQPFDMSNDRDSTQSASPINLRQCLKGILCRDDASKHTTALRSIKLLVQSKSSDLKEVCVELVKVLIHLDDIFPMDDFLLVKLEAMVELTTACPNQVTPFLCEQFYFPNYTILQRMNILESLTGAAVKLSTPVKDHEIKEYTISSVSSSQVKPWQKVVEERIKSKTRIISTKREQRVDGAANRFSDVCGMFFFPLMVNYDTKVNTLDLLGKDSLLLGQLLNTLGTVVHLAVHSPLVPVMASTLVEFCWLFKYHTEISVRQGVLYCVSCLLSSLPSSSLPLLIDKGLHEMMLWVKGRL